MPTRRKLSTWGYIYIIKSSTGLFKIGLSKDVKRRLGEHRRERPSEALVLVRVIETDNMVTTERQLHNVLSRKHQFGEWYSLDVNDFKFIDLIENNIKSYIDDIR